MLTPWQVPRRSRRTTVSKVVDVLDDPDQLLGLHQVEAYGTVDVLALGDDVFGYVPDDGALTTEVWPPVLFTCWEVSPKWSRYR